MRPRIALLAAGVLACASARADSVVEMYGSIMPLLDSVQVTGATTVAPATADRPNQVSAASYTGLNEARLTVHNASVGGVFVARLSAVQRVRRQAEQILHRKSDARRDVLLQLGQRDHDVGFAVAMVEIKRRKHITSGGHC